MCPERLMQNVSVEPGKSYKVSFDVMSATDKLSFGFGSDFEGTVDNIAIMPIDQYPPGRMNRAARRAWLKNKRR